jgi:hypothetical protein
LPLQIGRISREEYSILHEILLSEGQLYQHNGGDEKRNQDNERRELPGEEALAQDDSLAPGRR